jgi:hypothetical protein
VIFKKPSLDFFSVLFCLFVLFSLPFFVFLAFSVFPFLVVLFIPIAVRASSPHSGSACVPVGDEKFLLLGENSSKLP